MDRLFILFIYHLPYISISPLLPTLVIAHFKLNIGDVFVNSQMFVFLEPMK